MAVFTDVPDSVFAVGKPITSTSYGYGRDNDNFFKDLFDGTTGHKHSGAADDGPVLASGSVTQTQLKSTTASQSFNVPKESYYNFNLTGGNYSLAWFLGANVSSPNIEFVAHDITYSARVRVYNNHTVSLKWAYVYSRYIQASPPYNLGNGDIPLFIFVIIDNATGDILGTSVAPDPCWAYNGPDVIDPKKKYKKKGKANQFYKKLLPLPDPDIDFAGYKAAINGPREEVEIEITQEVKNQNMIHVPHPFIGNDLTGKSIVMVDPVGQLTDKLALLHEDGECISSLLHKRHLLIDNISLDINTPPGVGAYKVKWKST